MNVFQQFIKSFSSPKAMAAFRFQGMGKTILYVFLLMFLASIPTGVSMGLMMNGWVEDSKAIISSELPDFEIIDGELTSEADEPIISENQDFVFIFDSTGELTEEEVAKYDDVLAFLKNDAYFSMAGDAQSMPYTSLGIDFTKADLLTFMNQMDTMLYVIIPVLYLILYIFQTGMKFIGISFLALIALLMSKSMKRNLLYKKVWIMSAYAVTIPTIFFALTDAFGILIPFAFLLYWLTASFIMYLVIKEVPPKKEVAS